MEKCKENVRLTKMLYATLVLLVFLSMIANGQQKDMEPNLEEEGSVDKDSEETEEDKKEDETPTENTPAPTTTAAAFPSTSTTSGGPSIFSTNSLVFSLVLSLKFFFA